MGTSVLSVMQNYSFVLQDDWGEGMVGSDLNYCVDSCCIFNDWFVKCAESVWWVCVAGVNKVDKVHTNTYLKQNKKTWFIISLKQYVCLRNTNDHMDNQFY